MAVPETAREEIGPGPKNILLLACISHKISHNA